MSQKNQKKKRNAKDGTETGDTTSLVKESDMPLATAILQEDVTTVGSILAQSLPNPDSVKVDEVAISKSLGESFTGGRSTPVYHVTCTVSRGGTRKQRHFVVKLVLMPSDAGEVILPQSLFQKRESYAVERRFYESAATRVRNQLNIPKFLYSDHDGRQPWPAVCFLMNDVRHAGFPSHPEFLSTAEAKRAIRWLATFHALFWNDQSRWKRDLWNRGGFWTPKEDKDGNIGNVKTSGLAQQWTQTLRWLENKHPSAISPHTKGLGKRLEAAVGPIAEFLTLQSSKIGTLMHGDFKAANMFFADTEGDEPGAESVAVLDFQFTGSGVGAEDVAYLLFPDARGHYFDDEASFLECYHEELVSQLILQQKGGPATLSLDSFRAFYELSRIDLARYLMVEKGWVGCNEGDMNLVAAMESAMARLDGGQVLSSEEDYHQAISNFVGLS